MENTKTNITIGKRAREILVNWKYSMDCKTYDDTIERVDQIIKQMENLQ